MKIKEVQDSLPFDNKVDKKMIKKFILPDLKFLISIKKRKNSKK